MRITGPLFRWFGSKWLSSKKLPPPQHDTIIEPFAGSAGYSLRYHERDVLLYESDAHIRELWEWLIGEATPSDILDIPIDYPVGYDFSESTLSMGQMLLLKNWQRTNNVGNCWTTSPWGHMPGQWTANCRARIAEEHQAIAHWQIHGPDGQNAFLDKRTIATWFIDPPYEYNYKYRSKENINYQALADSIQKVKGQVIVCEAICQKTQAVPTWLPFKFFGNRITSRRKVDNNHHSKELIYTRSL